MSKTILQTITNKIAYHEDELHKLRIAQEVVARLNDATKTAGDGVAAEQGLGGPMFVVTRTDPPKSILPKKVKRKLTPEKIAENIARAAELRDRILNILSDNMSRGTPLLIDMLGLKGAPADERQKVYAAVSKLLSSGLIKRDDQKNYFVPSTYRTISTFTQSLVN